MTRTGGRRGSEEGVEDGGRNGMDRAAAKPRRKSRRANVVLNFDRKTAAGFPGGWSIRLEPLPNRLSANKFPRQTSCERAKESTVPRVVQAWTPRAAEMGRDSGVWHRGRESARSLKRRGKRQQGREEGKNTLVNGR